MASKKGKSSNPNNIIGRLDLLEFRINEHNRKIDKLCGKIDKLELGFATFSQDFKTIKGMLKYFAVTLLGGILGVLFWLVRGLF